MRILFLVAVLAVPGWLSAQQPEVQVLASELAGSRAIEPQTQSAVVRDYQASWTSLSAALAQNNAALLDADFVGTARSKLGDTITQQAAAGVHATYRATSHAITFVFYSPEGSSIEFFDTVSYEEEVRQGDQVLARHPVSARYLVVMTPAQVRWQVRILQAAAVASK